MTTPHPLDEQFKNLKISIPQASPHIVVVEMNRPRKRNAMSAALWREIGEVFSRLGMVGDDCRCIIVAGVGKAFSSGIDLSDPTLFPSSNEDDDPARRGLAFPPQIRDMQNCFTAIEDCPVPVIAAIHGNCIGAGIDLACCCDIRIAQIGATFSVREVRIGLAADIGTLQRLPKITGNDSRVRELCYTGGNFDHQEALNIGFVSRVCENAMTDAIQLGSLIASNSPIAVMGTKRSLIYSRDHTVAEGLEHIANHNALALMTSDIPTAFMASANKQRPQFPNLPPFSRL
jgi:delta(3,5)-delta(2,4)-dienoyl-CoA isomerase